jgi:hypothetical protein
MKTIGMQAPVIVMGMTRSGTTLLAEMLHKGGTPMYDIAQETDPSYDSGIRYERRLTQELNLRILGLLGNRESITLLDLPLHPLPPDALDRLATEVRDEPWGFKNPRTTLTYPIWCEAFPQGPRLYVYRSHEEVVRFYFHTRRNVLSRIKRARRGLYAWIRYNEQVLLNMDMDRQAGRPSALVRYEELMQEESLLRKIEEAVEVPLCDARKTDMHRNCLRCPRERFFLRLLTRDTQAHLDKIYTELGQLRLCTDRVSTSVTTRSANPHSQYGTSIPLPESGT